MTKIVQMPNKAQEESSPQIPTDWNAAVQFELLVNQMGRTIRALQNLPDVAPAAWDGRERDRYRHAMQKAVWGFFDVPQSLARSWAAGDVLTLLDMWLYGDGYDDFLNRQQTGEIDAAHETMAYILAEKVINTYFKVLTNGQGAKVAQQQCEWERLERGRSDA